MEYNIVTKNEKKAHYVDRKEFYDNLVKHFENCKKAEENGEKEPVLPNYIAEAFMKIAEGLSHQSYYIGYSFREDMVADAVENCLRYYRNFDTDKYDNPFAYFTQISKYAFYRRIAKEKKELYRKYKLAQFQGILDEQNQFDPETGGSVQFELYDNLSEFIKNYEDAKTRKNAEKKAKGIENFFEE